MHPSSTNAVHGRVHADLVRRQIESVLVAWGMPEENAATAAEVMVETDLRGIDSHGLNTLRQYDETFRRGALKPAAPITVLRDRPTTALLDAGDGLGHPVSVKAMAMAVEKARTNDLGLVCVVNSHHFGAAGHYAKQAAEAGMIGVVTTSTRGITMVPTGGTSPVLGTNPFAFGAPAGKYPPLVLDFATTVAAVNKVRVYARRGRPLPEGWVDDGKGAAVTDGEKALSIFAERSLGGLNPFGGAGTVLGGHKGYGLALFSHILGGALPGGSFSPERVKSQSRDGADKIGHFFLAVNPAAFRDIEDYTADVEIVVETLKAVPPADPAHPVLVAGEPEEATRADRLANGIPVDDNLRVIVRRIAEEAGVEYVLG